MAALPTFDELAKRPDEAIDVALGAALIAKDVHQGLDIDALLSEIASLGEPLRATDLSRASPAEKAAAVSECFRAQGFRGNVEDYYDPKNSLLPDVVARRTGIPITLSILWCEMAAAAGVEARGVAFPGHFLVRVGSDAEQVIVDPFEGGRLVDEEAARALLRRTIGATAELHPSWFAPASPRAILVRLLNNLKAVWAQRGEHARAFVAIDRIVTLVPDSARMLRERAAVALRLGIHELARADLARVLELEPSAPDAVHIAGRLRELASGLASGRIAN